MINISSLRFTGKKSNPIVQDYHICNEILLYGINKSIFHYKVTIGGDCTYLINNKYNSNSCNIEISFERYSLDADRIKEFFKFVGIALSTDKINVFVEKINYVNAFDHYETYISITDQEGSSITHVRYILKDEPVDFFSLKNRKWIKLNRLNEQVLLYFENPERIAAESLYYLSYAFAFNGNSILESRIFNLINVHEFSSANLKRCLGKFADTYRIKKDELMSVIYSNILEMDLDDKIKKLVISIH